MRPELGARIGARIGTGAHRRPRGRAAEEYGPGHCGQARVCTGGDGLGGAADPPAPTQLSLIDWARAQHLWDSLRSPPLSPPHSGTGGGAWGGGWGRLIPFPCMG